MISVRASPAQYHKRAVTDSVLIGNLLSPYQLALPEAAGVSVMAGETAAFLDGATPGLPTRVEAISWYSQASGWEIFPSEIFWGDAFGFVRV